MVERLLLAYLSVSRCGLIVGEKLTEAKVSRSSRCSLMERSGSDCSLEAISIVEVVYKMKLVVEQIRSRFYGLLFC